MSEITDHLKLIEREIAKARSVYPDNQMEVEARFWKITSEGESPLKAADFLRLQETLNKSTLVPVHEYSVDESQGNIRKTNINETVTWKKKQRLFSVEIPEYALKIAVNAEIPITPPKSFQPTVTRTKDRYSYLFSSGSYRLDMTRVQMVDEKNIPSTRYEVEAELMDVGKITGFLKSLEGFVRAIHGSETLYSLPILQQLTKDITRQFELKNLYHFNRDVLVQARNIKSDDLVYGGLVGNPFTPYYVTHKADGRRQLVIFHKTGLWACMPPYEYNRIMKVVDNTKLWNTYLDGEMIPKEQRRKDEASPPKSKYWFLSFDILALQKQQDIRNATFSQRNHMMTMIAQEYKNNDLLVINSKDVFTIVEPIDMFAVMSVMAIQRDILAYKQDGFMFGPLLTPYNNNSHLLPASERVLTKNPDIVKWKPAEELTIDFALMKKINSKTNKQEIHVLSSKRGQKDPVEFIGTRKSPFDSKTMIDATHPMLAGLQTGTVVEFEWNTMMKKLVPKKIRSDKSVGNDIEVAEQVWDDIFNPIPITTLEGNDFMYLFSFIRRTVQQLITSITTGKVVVYSESDTFFIIKSIVSTYDHVIVADKKTKTLPSNTSLIIAFMVQPPSTVWSGDFPVIFLGLDSFIVRGKFGETKSIMLNSEKITLSSSHVEFLGTQYPLIDYSSFETKQKSILDTYTLNFERLMSEEEKELSRWFRVVIYGVASKNLSYFIDPKLKTRHDYPVRRVWSVLNEDTFGEKRLLTPLQNKEKLAKNESLMYNLSNVQVVPEDDGITLDELAPSLEAISDRISNPLKMLRPVVIQPLPNTEEENEPEAIDLDQQEEEEQEEQEEQEEEEQEHKSLRNFGLIREDATEKIPCSWYDRNLVRIGVLGDGSCLIHAIVKGFARDYQEDNDTEFRRDYVKLLRDGVAQSLTQKDPDNKKGKTYYETTGGGALAKLGSKYKSEEKEEVEDFSLEGVRKLLLSKSHLGDEVMSLLAQLLGVNIYILRVGKNDTYKHDQVIYKKNKGTVVIHGDGTHFETIGVERSGGIQTYFENDDRFLKAIISKASGWVE